MHNSHESERIGAAIEAILLAQLRMRTVAAVLMNVDNDLAQAGRKLLKETAIEMDSYLLRVRVIGIA